MSEIDDDSSVCSSSNNGSRYIEEDSTSDDIHNGSSSSSSQTSDESSSTLEMTRDGTAGIRRSKTIILCLIALVASAVGTMTYLLVRNEETLNFETEARENAVEISSLVHSEVKIVFQNMENFALTISSYADETNVSWPFIHVPHFELRGTLSNKLSGALQTAYAPLVTQEKRQERQDFVVSHQDLRSGKQEEKATSSRHIISKHIFEFDDMEEGSPTIRGDPVVLNGHRHYAPIWQQAPAPSNPSSIINYDLLSHPIFEKVYRGMQESGSAVLSEVTNLDWFYGGAVQDDVNHPHSFILQPLYPRVRQDAVYDIAGISGFVVGILSMDKYFSNALHEGASGMVVVLHDSCGGHFTYHLNGPEAVFLGKGDLHDKKYDHLGLFTELAPFLQDHASANGYNCTHHIGIYPSQLLEAEFRSKKPIGYATAIVAVFVMTAMVFVLYDIMVSRRHRLLTATASRTAKIVGAMFPKNVRDRIIQDAEEENVQHSKKPRKTEIMRKWRVAGTKGRLGSFLEGQDSSAITSKPIADLFPHVTVMFADVVGFTAWSSAREPAQVFTLLETVFSAFDELAKKRRIFKVETVGDCYVAVAGLPDKRRDHAVVMARFARDCLHVMTDLTKQLEVALGPDTADLSIRIGLHSGPVTAGVLRGERSRFQLFGDTMNTTSRIESTGAANLTHMSADTAELLMKAGKAHWCTKREDKVEAKGKGEMETYWLENEMPTNSLDQSTGKSSQEGEESAETSTAGGVRSLAGNKQQSMTGSDLVGKPTSLPNDKQQRLIDWNTDVLLRLLRELMVRNESHNKADKEHEEELQRLEEVTLVSGTRVLNEVEEVIQLPSFDAKIYQTQKEPDSVILSQEVVEQARNYVSIIAALYRNNPFHNFEHASHVLMSTGKLLSRIATPDQTDSDIMDANDDHHRQHEDLQFGISTDPLTRFACIFSALIHDVDHVGVPNSQLIKENLPIARVYQNRSVAEQNSVQLAWNLLMDCAFDDFRRAIYSTPGEFFRFRKLVVNCVMATDIMDKELKAIRNAKWDKAFQKQVATSSGRTATDDTDHDDNDNETILHRQATIVIEHLIQASDVSHTMQHWHIYRKWNQRLFMEMYKAYKEGRAEKNPSEFWYTGEIGFFDYYILPLAKKLKTCGVFGVSSDEYLNYAMKNRREWEARGKELVASYLEQVENNP